MMKVILYSFFFLFTFDISAGKSLKVKRNNDGSPNSDEPTMDIGFLIENPGTGKPEGQELDENDKDVFVESREFAIDVVKHFNVSVTGNHVGIVTYGQRPYMAFDFNEHLSNGRVRKAITGLHRPYRGSNTAKALIFAKNQLFDGSARPESRKLLIILASKASKDNSPKIADQLKKSGVTIYTIGIDSKGGMVEFNDVVSDPIETHKFLTKLKHLRDLATKVKDIIIKDARQASKAISPNGKQIKNTDRDELPHDELPRLHSEITGPREEPKDVIQKTKTQLNAKQASKEITGPREEPKDVIQKTKTQLKTGKTHNSVDETPELRTIMPSAYKPTPNITASVSEPTMARDALPKPETQSEEKLPTPPDADPMTATPIMSSDELPNENREDTPSSKEQTPGSPAGELSQEPASHSPAPGQSKESAPDRPSPGPSKEPTPDSTTQKTHKEATLNSPSKESSKEETPNSPVPEPSKQLTPDNSAPEPSIEPTPGSAAPELSKELSPESPAPELSKEPTPHSPAPEPSKEPSLDSQHHQTSKEGIPDNPAPEPSKEATPDSPVPEPLKEPTHHSPVPEPSKEPTPDSPAPEPYKEVTPDIPAQESSKEPTPDNPDPEPPKKSSPDSPAPEPSKEATPDSPAPEPSIEAIPDSPDPEPSKEATPDSPVPDTAIEATPDSPALEPSKEATPDSPAQEPSKETTADSPDTETYTDRPAPELSKEPVPVRTESESEPKKSKASSNNKKGKKHKLLTENKPIIAKILTESKPIIAKMPLPESGPQLTVTGEAKPVDTRKPVLVASHASDENPSKRVFMPRASNVSVEENEEETKTGKDDIEYQLQRKLFDVNNGLLDESKGNKESSEISDMDDEESELQDSTNTQPASNVVGKECKARVDLAFLLDGSDQIGEENFQNSVTFTKKIIKSFTVSNTEVHVAVAVCSERPHVLFDLRAFTDHKGIERAMSSITYPKGKMFTGGCLKTIRSGIFVNSGRHDVPKILYFMSGGKSRDNVLLPSRALRDLGVQVFSLGLGNKYSGRELKSLSTAPYSDHVMATKYEILYLLRPFVTAQLCRGSGGKLVTPNAKAKKYLSLRRSSSLKTKETTSQIKAKVPKVITRASLLNKETEESKAKRRAALKSDIKHKLHILLSKFGKSHHSENAAYRSIINNINGHKDAECNDYHILCKSWNKEGLCKKSSQYGIDSYSVQRVCPKTCGVCYP